jgi:hypothetical protein
MRYDVVYKGCIQQTRQQVETLQEAAGIIADSGNNPNCYVIENNATGISIVYAEIQHYIN